MGNVRAAGRQLSKRCLVWCLVALTWSGVAGAQGAPTVLHLPGGTLAGVVHLEGVVYGVTYEGGTHNLGTLYSAPANLSTYTILHSFAPGEGRGTPYAELLVGRDLAGVPTLFGTTKDAAVFAYTPTTGVFRMLTPGGASAAGALTQVGEYLYGATNGYPTPGASTLYRLKVDGTDFRTIHTFTGPDGLAPHGVRLGLDGRLYGLALFGGLIQVAGQCEEQFGCGTLFSLNPDADGTDFQVLHQFQRRPGSTGPEARRDINPNRGIEFIAGTVYGTTQGSVFSWDPLLGYRRIYSPTTTFINQVFAGPTFGLDVRLYYPVYDGGTNFAGGIYSIDLQGTTPRLPHSFNFSAGPAGPYGLLSIGEDGDLYGTTEYSAEGPGTVFSLVMNPGDTDLRMTRLRALERHGFADPPGPPIIGDTVPVGREFWVEYVVRNDGPDRARGVRARLTLSDNVVPTASTLLDGSQIPCTISGGVVTCPETDWLTGVTRTLHIRMQVLQAGPITIDATVTSTNNELAPGNNGGRLSLTGVPQATADLRKTVLRPVDGGNSVFDPPGLPLPTFNVDVGQEFYVEFEAVNEGPHAATNVLATFTISPTIGSIRVLDENGAQVPCLFPAQGSSVITCQRTEWYTNMPRTLFLRVQVLSPGAITIDATIGASEIDPTAGNNGGRLEMYARSADLRTSLSLTSGTVATGQELLLTQLLENAVGPDSAIDITTDITLTNATFVSYQGTGCAPFGPGTRCTVAGAIGTSGILARELRVRVIGPGAVTVAVHSRARTADPDLSNNSATFTQEAVAAADVKWTGSTHVPNGAVAGDVYPFSFDVRNLGASDATNGRVTVTVPASVEFIRARILTAIGLISMPCAEAVSGPARVITCVGLPAAWAKDVTIATDWEVRPRQAGNFVFTVGAAAAELDPDPANNSRDLEVNVTAGRADIQWNNVRLTPAGAAGPQVTWPLAVGEAYSQTASIFNEEFQPAFNVVRLYTLTGPAEWLPSPGCVVAGSQLRCEHPFLPVGLPPVQADLYANFRVTGTGAVRVTAVLSSDTPDPSPANNTFTITYDAVTPIADVETSFVLGPRFHRADLGAVFTIEQRLNNLGPHSATQARVGLVLPDGTEFVRATALTLIGPMPLSCSPLNGTGTGMECTLLPGSWEKDVQLQVTWELRGTTVGNKRFLIGVTTATTDPVRSNNDREITINVVGPLADLGWSTSRVTLATNTSTNHNGTFHIGNDYSFIVTFANAGPDIAKDVVATYTISGPAEWLPSAGCGIFGPELKCLLAQLAPGPSVEPHANFRVTGVGFITLTLALTASTTDPFLGDNGTGLGITAIDEADLRLSTALVLDSTNDFAQTLLVGRQYRVPVSFMNEGLQTAQSVVIRYSLTGPVRWSGTTQGDCTFSGLEGTCAVGSMGGLAQAFANLSFTVLGPGAVTVATTIASTTPDHNPANNGRTIPLVARDAQSDLVATRVTLDPIGPAFVGNQVGADVLFRNFGPDSATNGTIRVLLDGLEFTTTPAFCTRTNTELVCPMGSWPVELTSRGFPLVLRAVRDGIVRMTATATAAEADPNPANNTVTRELNVVPFPSCATNVTDQLSLVRSGLRMSTLLNGQVVYRQTLSVTNASTAPVNGPLAVVLYGLSSNASVVNPSGFTSCVTPSGQTYLTVDAGPDGVLSPGETTTVGVTFVNPSRAPITYSPFVVSGARR